MNALVRARVIRARFGAAWGIGETGAAGTNDRVANMHAFAAAALQLFAEAIA